MSDDVLLTRDCDTILPYGLKTTPFEIVFRAIQAAAGDVWDVDPSVYRAAIAWAYYLTHDREPLIRLRDGLAVLSAIAVSEAVPLVAGYMDAAQLVELLAQWHDYRPSQAALERLYGAYGMTVDVRQITDSEGQAILPHPVERGAFYVIARAIDWGRGLTPEELAIVAERATPLGGRPVVVYALTDNRIDVAAHARTAGASQVVWSDTPAAEYVPPAPSEIRGYTTSSGAADAQNVSVGRNGWRQLYDAQGQLFAFNPGYTLTAVFYQGGSGLVAYGVPGAFRLFHRDRTYDLCVRNGIGYEAKIAVVEFVELEPARAYINQYSHSSDWSLTYNSPTPLYDENGNAIPYESGKLYTLTACIKADGALTALTQYVEAVDVNGVLGYRSSVSGTACYFYYTVRDLTYYGYAYNLTPATIRSTSSSYIHIYEADGTTAKFYDRSKQYTILHVWSASGVLADEYLPDLYFTPSSPSASSASINLKLKTTSTYSSATIWCVEYLETDLS